MKKTLLMLFAVCVLFGMLSICTSAAETNYGKSYSAPYGTPAIDGKGDDDIWKLARWEDINVNAASNKMAVRFKAAHDANLIYFLVEATDPAPSALVKETLWFQLHSHACSTPSTCTTYTHHLMTFAGSIWDNVAGKNVANASYKVTSVGSGTSKIFTLEWAFDPAEAIPTDSSTPFGLEWVTDDYTESNSWVSGPQTWNSHNDLLANKTINFGNLFFYTEAETGELALADFYNDVPLSHEAYEAIRYTSQNGIFMSATESNPSFYPDNKLSRAQFVTILGRLAGADVSSYMTTAFTDVDMVRDAWYAKYAEWARMNGIVVGSQFMANKEITVAEAVVMIQRYADKVDNCYEPSVTSLDPNRYTDTATIPAWAKDAIQWAHKNRIYPFDQSATTIAPTKIMTRAMAAMLVYNYDIAVIETGTDNTPTITVKEPPSDIDWERVAIINALDFGFVNDGVTPNDDIMAYYLEHYAHYIPIEFPQGKYVFKYQIDFPSRIYVELTPKAEWILMSDTVQDYFITLQKGMEEWGDWDEYAHHSYFRGGNINVNYNAKVGIGAHGGFQTNFEDFTIYNVLERGLQTEINNLHNGAYYFQNILIYNDKAIEGTWGIYDNGYDNSFVKCTTVNVQNCIYTSGGMFTECSGWFNSYGKSLIPNSVYATVADGYQAVFNTPLVDTYRYGFDIDPWASVTINDLMWITNTNFYTSDLQTAYPMVIFLVERADTQIMVNGLAFKYISGTEFSFSNMQLTHSVFLNVRYKNISNPHQIITNFRDDTKKFLQNVSPYAW